mgnify:CR=1 FL=1
MLGAAVAAEAAALPGQEARAPATAQAAGPVAEPNEGGGHRGAEEDTLEAMLEEVGGRKRGRQEMFARMDAEADARMDNGVRINPMLKEMARRAAVAEEVAGTASLRAKRVTLWRGAVKGRRACGATAGAGVGSNGVRDGGAVRRATSTCARSAVGHGRCEDMDGMGDDDLLMCAHLNKDPW